MANESSQKAPFRAFYDAQFDFAWRNLRRLGVPERRVDDALQEVFLVAHRHYEELRDPTGTRSWLFAIVVRVASGHRRNVRRKGDVTAATEVLDTARSPYECAERNQGLEVLCSLLAKVPEEQRAVFVLAELEGMTAPEIASALEVTVNTVYSRLRLARVAFESQVSRYQRGAP